MEPLKIKAVMTPCPYTIEHDTPIQKALERLKLYNIRHLPVVRGGDLVGVVSERDLDLGAIMIKSNSLGPKVGEICQRDPFVVDQDDGLAEVAQEMAERKYDYALVTDADLKFVGIFTTNDACRVVHMLLAEGERS